MKTTKQIFFPRIQPTLKIIVLTFLFCSISRTQSAQAHKADNYPIPANKSNMLFYLQRTKDANTVVYELNYDKGKLNEQQPVKVYWIRYAEDAKQQELSTIQKRFAFGINSKKQNDGNFQLTLAGYEKIPIILKRVSTNTFKAHLTIDKQEIVLSRIYIHLSPGGSFWSPKIDYIEFKGICTKSEKSVIKQIKP